MSDKENDQILEIGARLKGSLKDKFLAIKEKRGLTADAELLRTLVSEEYDRMTVKVTA